MRPGRLLWAMLSVTGYLLFMLAATQIINARIAPEYTGDSIVAAVRIADFPRRGAATVSFTAEVAANPWIPRRIRVSWFEPPEMPRFGDRWQLELRLRRPRGNANPLPFDYETWLFREGIAATAYVVDGRRNELRGRDQLGFVERLRVAAVSTRRSGTDTQEPAPAT